MLHYYGYQNAGGDEVRTTNTATWKIMRYTPFVPVGNSVGNKNDSLGAGSYVSNDEVYRHQDIVSNDYAAGGLNVVHTLTSAAVNTHPKGNVVSAAAGDLGPSVASVTASALGDRCRGLGWNSKIGRFDRAEHGRRMRIHELDSAAAHKGMMEINNNMSLGVLAFLRTSW